MTKRQILLLLVGITLVVLAVLKCPSRFARKKDPACWLAEVLGPTFCVVAWKRWVLNDEEG